MREKAHLLWHDYFGNPDTGSDAFDSHERRFIVVASEEQKSWSVQGMQFVFFDLVDRPRDEDEQCPPVNIQEAAGDDEICNKIVNIRAKVPWRSLLLEQKEDVRRGEKNPNRTVGTRERV